MTLRMLVFLCALAIASGAQGLFATEPYRGIAVLSSSVGTDVPADRIVDLVKTCKLNLVVIDFAYITHHWPRTDDAAGELVERLQDGGVEVALMYRPRTLRPGDARVRYLKGEDGTIPPSHNELDFNHQDSIDWGAEWGVRMLRRFPTVDRVVLYNLRGPKGPAKAFLRHCRSAWSDVRDGIRIGHVGGGAEFADEVDWVLPFYPVNRFDDRPIGFARVTREMVDLKSRLAEQQFTPLLKIDWANETNNTTDDIVEAVDACDAFGTGFLLWNYNHVFQREGGYRLPSLVSNLGGDWGALSNRFAELTNTEKASDVDADVANWIARLATRDDKRFEALNKLVRLKSKAFGPLRKLMLDQSEDPNRRWQAAKALGAIGDKAAIPDLLRVLGETDQATAVVRRVAVEALLRIGDEATTRRLMDLARDPRTPDALKQMLLVTLDPKRNPLAESVWEKQFDWAESHQDALGRAGKENKLVMTIVYAHENLKPVVGRIDLSTVPYQVLIRGPLTDPDVRALIQKRFVMRSVSFHIHAFSRDLPPRAPDPLAELRTNSRDTQPPAILFHQADGKLVGRINAIGVFNSRYLHAAMTAVLKVSNRAESGDLVDVPAEIPDERKDDWVQAKLHYLSGDTEKAIQAIDKLLSRSPNKNANAVLKSFRGKVMHHDGKKSEARRWFSEALELGLQGDQLGEAWYWLFDCEPSAPAKKHLTTQFESHGDELADSIWLEKIRSRLPGTDLHIAEAESFDPPDSVEEILDERVAPIELGQAVPRALEYLVRSQSEYGDWRPLSQDYQLFAGPAVTAICGNAIHTWLRDPGRVPIPDELLGQMRESEQATRQSIARYAPGMTNFGRINYAQVWNQTYMLEYVLGLLEDDPADKELIGYGQQLVDLLLKHQYDEGGWSYLPPSSVERWGGIRPHSFNTAPILIELVKADQLGLRVDPGAIKRAKASLESVRAGDGAFAYAPASGFAWMTKQRSAIARDSLCELALNAAGGHNKDALGDALERFHAYRADLDVPRKLYSSYFNPNGHGAYFYAFGYYYASEALRHMKDDKRPGVARDLQNDLLRAVEMDGTWIDSHAQGKAYATGMVLRALHNTAKYSRAGDD